MLNKHDQMRNRRRYGISCISLLPWSFGPGGFQRAVIRATKVGFDGIQALPLRGWRYKDRHLDPYVISCEGAWAWGDWNDIILRYKGELHEKPLLRDYILFGQEYFPLIPTAVSSGYTFLAEPDASYGINTTEIHPELSIAVEDYMLYVETGGLLCWDTHHVRRSYRNLPNGDPLIDWRQLLDVLPSDSIGLIHVQPLSQQEEDLFLYGENCTLLFMLSILAEKCPDVPVILEIAPNLKKIWKEPARQRAWLLRLKEVMG